MQAGSEYTHSKRNDQHKAGQKVQNALFLFHLTVPGGRPGFWLREVPHKKTVRFKSLPPEGLIMHDP
eukprot:4112272-Amphidinium_carterae.1